MNVLVLFRLLARRSVIITLSIWFVTGVVLLHNCGTIYKQVPPVRIYFRLAYTALVIGSLISFGGFIAKVTSELEGVRLSRTVPRLRRRINGSVLFCVPVVATMAVVFLYLAIPEAPGALPVLPLWLTAAFLFCLGFGLGWSWLLFVALVVFLAKISWVFHVLRNHPIPSSIVLFGLCLGLLAIRHRRFLTSPGAPNRHAFSWLTSVFNIGPQPRRTGQTLRDRPDWPEETASVAVAKLLKAGVHERLGHKRGGLWGWTTLSVLLVYFIFGGLIIWAWTGQQALTLKEFAATMFTQSPPDKLAQLADALRVIFAVTTAMIAFLCSLLLDTTLLPNLWHPISRRVRGQSAFLSHLRQNLIFTAVHLSAAFVVVLAFHVAFSTPVSRATLSAFLAPVVFAFILMPFAQAMFPNAVQTFRTKTDPKTQLLAGLTGGLFCLLTAYWTSYWPAKALHDQLSDGWRVAFLVGTAAATYGAYYVLLRWRCTRMDLRFRTT